jgi:hypothetical protein
VTPYYINNASSARKQLLTGITVPEKAKNSGVSRNWYFFY